MFNPGDTVQMPGVPFMLTVLEVAQCTDGCVEQIFRFADPETGESDWMHSSEFVKASGS